MVDPQGILDQQILLEEQRAIVQNLKRQKLLLEEQLQRFNVFINRFNPTTNSLGELEIRVSKIEDFLESYNSILRELEMSNDFDQEADRIEFESQFFMGIGKARDILKQEVTIKPKVELDQSSSFHNVKLPSINISIFDGSLDGWLPFLSTFNSLIHNNTNLDGVHKFHYLISYLKGEPLEIIQSIQISNENYIIAWDLLNDRYNNNKLMILNHIRALFELETVNKESSLGYRNLVNNVNKHLKALKYLKQPVEHWDSLLIYLLTSKLDFYTKKEWEKEQSSIDGDKLPTLEQVLSFLNKKSQVLESLEFDKHNKSQHSCQQRNKNQNLNPNKINSNQPNKFQSYFATNTNCQVCNSKPNHSLYSCPKFLNMPVQDKINEVKKLKLCLNCLNSNHFVPECKGRTCKKCNKKHNTLLHIESQSQLSQPQGQNISQNNENQNTNINSNTNLNANPIQGADGTQPVSQNMHVKSNNLQNVLLSTATMLVSDVNGQFHKCRVLLDCGSQSNFITQELVDKLHLITNKIQIPITGINQSHSEITNMVVSNCRNIFNDLEFKASFLIVENITESLPNSQFDISKLKIPNNITLSDPDFNKPSQIDILLGASLFWDLLCVGKIVLNKNLSVRKTRLGWIFTGIIPSPFNGFCSLLTCHNLVRKSDDTLDLNESLKKFWELEECSTNQKYLTADEQECEDIFKDHSRDINGRFILRLPFNKNKIQLGESKSIAHKRFLLLEKRLNSDNSLNTKYSSFMKEYLELNHMSLNVDSEHITQEYFLPHHAVFKETSLTTKLRVVFDGSCKTSSGFSLNDTLLIGPKIQTDIFDILLRFRQYKYVFIADIEKMYRQILIHPDDRVFQQILWRDDPSKDIQAFCLNTVTYGTSSAPYLAIRCLQELAYQFQTEFPKASKMILDNFYVDDLLSGSNTISESKVLITQINQILLSAGFELRKWISNDPQVLSDIQSNNQDQSTILNLSESTQTLGLTWNSKNDIFSYNIHLERYSSDRVTKRLILSTIAHIFDPLGLIGPVTIRTKILLQKLWQLNVSWDESLPNDIFCLWQQIKADLQSVSIIQVPRFMSVSDPDSVQIHGFSDASEVAYGACVYLRITKNDICNVHLMCAKSKVAPLKVTTLPRLELCAAVLLAKLVKKVKSIIDISIQETFLWCDSQITLAWIAQPPGQWKTFIANRVSEIQQLSNKDDWHYVNSKDNPADIISRGMNPKELNNASIWWFGPKWLGLEQRFRGDLAPPRIIYSDVELEKKKLVFCNLVNVKDQFDIFNKFSSFSKLQRVIGYCYRFKQSLKKQNFNRSESLTVEELDESLKILIKLIQAELFFQTIHALKTKSRQINQSKLLSLSPFLDNDGLLRVGGRLQNSHLNSSAKHPLILPSKHPFTILLIRDYHYKHLHAGVQLLLNIIREKFWIISAKNTIKKVLHGCLVCYKNKPITHTNLMGNLPQDRLIPSRPFMHCGVDYAGYFLIKANSLRNAKLIKAYVCVFVCFSTKAIHLELVADLSTDTFLNALKRFISRRGLPLHIHSDNGTNFVGANNEMVNFREFLVNNNDEIISFATNNHINWHFIPAHSPSMGGLWESAVKSFKYHLKRVVQNSHLTFEQFSTVLCQIEACLNSRPISPLSNDPNDLNPLTPGHFLIGTSLVNIPEPNLLDVQTTRLNKFQLISQLTQSFWKRWSQEYLHHLQQRVKWKENCSSLLSENSLVLIKEDNLPPLLWKVGRVINLYKGDDDVSRVVDIRTSNGVIKRHISKICILPIS